MRKLRGGEEREGGPAGDRSLLDWGPGRSGCLQAQHGLKGRRKNRRAGGWGSGLREAGVAQDAEGPSSPPSPCVLAGVGPGVGGSRHSTGSSGIFLFFENKSIGI